jgi:hypothetical protein
VSINTGEDWTAESREWQASEVVNELISPINELTDMAIKAFRIAGSKRFLKALYKRTECGLGVEQTSPLRKGVTRCVIATHSVRQQVFEAHLYPLIDE